MKKINWKYVKGQKIFCFKVQNLSRISQVFLVFFLNSDESQNLCELLRKKVKTIFYFSCCFYLWLSDIFFCRRRKKKILICQSFFALDPLYKEPFTQLHRGATQSLKKGENSAIIMRWVFFLLFYKIFPWLSQKVWNLMIC